LDGAEAFRTILVVIRTPYEHQEFNLAGSPLAKHSAASGG
jgi:hypothetical protein